MSNSRRNNNDWKHSANNGVQYGTCKSSFELFQHPDQVRKMFQGIYLKVHAINRMTANTDNSWIDLQAEEYQQAEDADETKYEAHEPNSPRIMLEATNRLISAIDLYVISNDLNDLQDSFDSFKVVVTHLKDAQAAQAAQAGNYLYGWGNILGTLFSSAGQIAAKTVGSCSASQARSVQETQTQLQLCIGYSEKIITIIDAHLYQRKVQNAPGNVMMR